MWHIVWLLLRLLEYPAVLIGAWFWERASRHFLAVKPGGLAYAVRLALFWTGMTGPMWIGDENLLFFLPMFIGLFYLGYQGTWAARVVVGMVFYLLLSGLGMILDTMFNGLPPGPLDISEVVPAGVKLVSAVLAYLLTRRRNPNQKALELSGRMWGLCALLSLAPLFTILSFSMWNGFGRNQMDLGQYRIAYTVLPFVVLSAVAILAAMILLSRQQELEREASLSNMREVYYENLQHRETQLRTLRHDLRNHLGAALGLLEQGEIAQAKRYLSELSDSPALYGVKRICENEIANVVLAEKMEAMGRCGLLADVLVAIPRDIPIADTDLCALLGNALDNAIEAGQKAEDKTILVRVRADRGMLMLRIENSFADAPNLLRGAFATTKENPKLHGFGIRGMQEIAARYGGTLETRATGHRFELVACLPLSADGAAPTAPAARP